MKSSFKKTILWAVYYFLLLQISTAGMGAAKPALLKRHTLQRSVEILNETFKNSKGSNVFVVLTNHWITL